MDLTTLPLLEYRLFGQVVEIGGTVFLTSLSEPFGITTKPERALPLEKVYGYEPFTDIPADAQHHILGVQGNLWTEFIATPEHLEYMLLPRMMALSEIQWSAPEKKDFTRFKESLRTHELPILDLLGYNYRKLDN